VLSSKLSKERRCGIEMKKYITKISLLFVSLLVISSGVILPSLPEITVEYREMNATFVELLGTLPALFTMLTVLFSPRLAKKIGYKLTVQLGLILLFISGILPIFVSDFWILFATRIGFGIGVGFFNPLLFSFSAAMYQDKELSDMIGYQSAFEGMGGIVTSFLVAYLVVGGWRHTLWTYLMVIPIFLLFTLFVPDLQNEAPELETTKQSKKPFRLDLSFVIYLFLLIILITVYMSISVKLTSLLTEGGFGTARDSSNALALMGIGAMGSGFLFGRAEAFFKQWLLPLAFSLLALSLLGLALTHQVWLLMLMCLLSGLSFRTFIPFLLNRANQVTDGSGEQRTSLLLAGFNIGSAFAPVSVRLLQNLFQLKTVSSIYLVEAGLVFLLALLTLIFSIMTRTKSLRS